MAGYVRNDTINNIADGNIINASDLDGEFDKLQTAFGAASGHNHSGSAGDGKPIESVGPAQDLVVSATAATPKTNNTLDVGATSFKFKDGFFAGKVDTGTITLGGTNVTSSAAELNILDGVTATTAELNLLDGITASTTELNYVDGVTSAIQTQLGTKQATITGAASTVVSSNLTADFAMVSDAAGKVAVHSTVTSTELGYLDGVTSAIQTQIGTKQATLTGAATTIASSDLTASRALASNASGKVVVSAVTDTELGYVSGVTSAIQTQIGTKQATLTGAATTIASADLTASRALASNASGKVVVSAVTDTELAKLSGLTPSTAELNFVDGVTSLIQTQLDAKAALASPALTGTPTAPTATAATNTTQIATTAFVTTADNLKANLASPTFTGTPAAPTATAATNTTQIATTAFVTTADNLKANLASPALTGTPTAPTASVATNTTQIATTAFVNAEISGDVGVANSSLVKTALNAGGSAPIYACRAWVNFNGDGTVAVSSSGNVTSVTDTATGRYTVNFTTAISDVNYSVAASAEKSSAQARPDCIVGVMTGGAATGSVAIGTVTTGAFTDFPTVYVTIIR